MNEVLEEIEHLDDNLLVPDSVVVFPPINDNDDVTDENSGDDEYVVMDNLPGSLLQTQAEVIFNRETYENAEDTDDDEDEIPLVIGCWKICQISFPHGNTNVLFIIRLII